MPARNGPRSVAAYAVHALFASILIAASAGAPYAAAGTSPIPGRTTRITILDVNGAEVVGNFAVLISPDGRSLLVRTSSPLLPGDTNDDSDIYLQDRATGSIERITLTDDETQPNGRTETLEWSPSQVSDDGRYVTFTSFATNMKGTDANGTLSDVFLRDRVAGTTRLVSVSSQGVQGSRESLYASLSDDGSTVAFVSFADNLVEGDTNLAPDVFVHDVATGKTERVSVFSGGGQAPYPGSFFPPEISGDGRHVVFENRFPLVPQAPNTSLNDIYVHDRVTRATERVSVASDGSEGQWGGVNSSVDPTISSDGRFVGFQSGDTNYVPNDTNGYTDGFVHDRQTGRTERLVGLDGQQGERGIFVRNVSGDGRFVMGDSPASNLGYEDGNGTNDVYRIDRLTGQVDLVSATARGSRRQRHVVHRHDE